MDKPPQGPNTQSDRIKKLIDTGAEIAGGAVGGALGFFAAGPAGAAILGSGGAAAAAMLRHVGEEVSERVLGPREEVRIGGVLTIAASEIQQRLNAGNQLRSDGFFEPNASGRSDAEEIAESVLLRSQREPEERKIPYMGHLLASVAFDPEIGGPLAHQIIKTAEQLTYRQLCILRLSVVSDAYELREADYRGYGEFGKDLYQVLYECFDLYSRGLINLSGEAALGISDVNPSRMKVQALGADIYNLMHLWLIPDSDLVPIVSQLQL